MIEARTSRRLLGTLAVISLWVHLPACNHPEIAPPPWIRRPDSSSVSMRPAYGEGVTRPFVLGGYAGATYGPPLVGRRVLGGPPVPAPPATPRVIVDQGTWAQE
jgi:hypothetical protein